jgi:hypothetical protein
MVKKKKNIKKKAELATKINKNLRLKLSKKHKKKKMPRESKLMI